MQLPMAAQTSNRSPGANASAGLYPNLIGRIDRPLRYHPDNGDFVIQNGQEYFNRSLYGGNTAFRVDGGDKPEFMMYLPGRGGNLRLALVHGGSAKWLHDASSIVTRYRPGELIYEIKDSSFGTQAEITVEVLAYAETEGVIVRTTATGIAPDMELLWAYGGVNGERGARDGDIGTERVPISEFFQFKSSFAKDNVIKLGTEGFTLNSSHASIVGVVPAGTQQQVRDAEQWNNLPALLTQDATSPKLSIVIGKAHLTSGQPLLLSLQRVNSESSKAPDLQVYRDVISSRSASNPQKSMSLLAQFARSTLPEHFARAEEHFAKLRSQIRVDTPDPYINAAVGSLNVMADALWDSDAGAIMHGAIAWRTALLGWRGPYVLDDLGWHERARTNFLTWLPRQNKSPIPPSLPPQDPKANLARNEAGLHSNGDISHSHYDMNMVFMDELFRHFLWTGDVDFARQSWPAIQRHLAWERRLFRREYGPEKLPLYEAYATIWASDDLYYDGGGSAYASAFNLYANRMAARIATMIGEDPSPYLKEADLIERGMRSLLWLPDQGTFAEYKDVIGNQIVHDDYGLWSFYHSVDEEAVSPREAWEMGTALEKHLRPIPVTGLEVPNDRPYHVFSETDWMPYSWSINNVVMDEHLHTALALWQGGHAEGAFNLMKGTLLASMYMGISPGNVGTMDYLDVYRRESQRDFGDAAGAMSRALVEGLFGIHPDALAGNLVVSPGFPADWAYATLDHPDVSVSFQRRDKADLWKIRQNGSRFKRLTLRVPAVFSEVSGVEVNGTKVDWTIDAKAAGRPVIEIQTAANPETSVHITWSGEVVNSEWLAKGENAGVDGDFMRMKRASLQWWACKDKQFPRTVTVSAPTNWRVSSDTKRFESINLNGFFNGQVTSIFEHGKYVSPRYPGVSLEIPAQGAGAWAGHLNLLPLIDDSGLRKVAGEEGGKLTMPNGVPFDTPSAMGKPNIVFTSQWDNHPRFATIPLSGHATHLYLLMAGSTNFMQSRIDNGEVVVSYADGTSARLALRNPETWWPIEQDYFIDDYQFPLTGALPPRVDLRTGKVRLLNLDTFKGKGREVPGGAATALELGLDPVKQLKSLTVRAIANDVVIGLMSATLERP
jgi:hypothetical protein